MPTVPQDHMPKQPPTVKPVKLHLSDSPDESYAPTTWGDSNVGSEYDLRVPSGQLCRIKGLSLQDLIFRGMIDSLDIVTHAMNELIQAKRPGATLHNAAQDQFAKEAGMKLLSNPDAPKIFETIDKVVMMVVSAPRLYPNVEEGEKRVKGRVYINQVSMSDKTYIFKTIMEGFEEAATFPQGPA